MCVIRIIIERKYICILKQLKNAIQRGAEIIHLIAEIYTDQTPLVNGQNCFDAAPYLMPGPTHSAAQM